MVQEQSEYQDLPSKQEEFFPLNKLILISFGVRFKNTFGALSELLIYFTYSSNSILATFSKNSSNGMSTISLYSFITF